MTGLFDGVAGVLSGVFGAPVTFLPASGGSQVVQSVFRETPITVTGPDGGDVLIVAPTWRVSRAVLASVARGDLITLADGRQFKILNQITTGSPAADAFTLCEMELVP
jgi:hypothetical protein